MIRWSPITIYYWQRLVEARAAILIAVLLAAVLTITIVMLGRMGPRGDLFGSSMSDDPAIICRIYGEGARVCFPAPEGVKRYREEQAEKREAQQ